MSLETRTGQEREQRMEYVRVAPHWAPDPRLVAVVLLAFGAMLALLLPGGGGGGVAHAQSPTPPNVTEYDPFAVRGAETISLYIKEPGDDGGSPITGYEYRARIAEVPAGSSVATTSYPTTWTPFPEYDGVSHDPDVEFVAIDAVETVAGVATTSTPLAEGFTYYIEVRAKNIAGAGDAFELTEDEDGEPITLKPNIPAVYSEGSVAVWGVIERTPYSPAPRVPTAEELRMDEAGDLQTRHFLDVDSGWISDDEDDLTTRTLHDDRFTFRHEWIRVKNGVETVVQTGFKDDGAAGTVYILTAADIGAQLKVRLTFRDDRYNMEEFITPLFPEGGTILAPATCAEPTYATGETEVWEELFAVSEVSSVGTRDLWGFADTTPEPFEAGPNTHAISRVYTDERSNDRDLVLTLGGVTNTNRGQFTLHVCGEAYPLRDALVPSRNNYKWPTTEEWSSYYTRDVRLSHDSNAPIVRTDPTMQPLVSNIEQSGTNFLDSNVFDFAQPFTTGSNAAGYSVTSVEIRLMTTSNVIPDTPKLTLHSGTGTGNQLAVFTKPTLASNTTDNYTYTLDTAVSLTASTTYWVVVDDGNFRIDVQTTASNGEDPTPLDGATIGDGVFSRGKTSTGPFTVHDANPPEIKIRVNGYRNNNAVSGLPAITAPSAFRVPAVLGVDLSGIADDNGVSNIATTTIYRWQRFAADGTTLEQDHISTASTYTLTAADADKKLKVVVHFVDDDNYTEGPLTSDATTEIVPAATCDAPQYVGGAVQMWTGKVTVEMGTGARSDASGYFDDGSTSNFGSLDSTSFTIGSNNYEVDIAYTRTDTSLSFSLNDALTSGEKNTLVLHICDQPLAFNLTGAGSGSHTYSFNKSAFPDVDMDWSNHAERTLYLSRDQAKPTFVEALVNDTSLEITFNEELGAAASLPNSAFTVKKGTGGTSQTLSGTPSISGRTVTLTLATGIAMADTDVKVAYTKPTTGSANKVVDAFTNEADTFGDMNVINALEDPTPPELLTGANVHVLEADGRTLTVKFNEALKSTSVPDRSAFTVKATPMGGSEGTVDVANTNGVTVSSSTVVLKLAKPIAHNDASVKVTYVKPLTGSVIEDIVGNDAEPFTDLDVLNNSAIPRVSVRAVHADASPAIAEPEFEFVASIAGNSRLTVGFELTQTEFYFSTTTYNVAILAQQTSASSPVAIFHSGVNEINTDGTATITVVGGNDHLPALPPNNAATVRVELPPSGPTAWVSHQQQAYTVNEGESEVLVGVVFNAGEGVAEPRRGFTVALLTEDNGTATINVDYRHISKNLDVRMQDWTATGSGGYTFTINQRIPIIEDELFEFDETFSAYFDSTPGQSERIVLPSGATNTALITIVDNDPLGVTRVIAASTPSTSTPSAGYYEVGDPITFEVEFNDSVTVTGTPLLAFELGGQGRRAAYQSGSDSSELLFTYTVASTDQDDHDGISWDAGSLSLNGGSIKYMHTNPLKQIAALLAYPAQTALPAQKVDTMKPSLVDASGAGNTLTLTFSEDLNTASPSASAFTVNVVGGTAVNTTGVSILGRVVTLTLGTELPGGPTVTVSYAKPSTNKIRDLSGKEADVFVNRNVFTVPPLEVGLVFGWDRYDVREGATVEVEFYLNYDPERTFNIPINRVGEGGASSADFNFPSTLRFDAGETFKTLTFRATNDQFAEDGERVVLSFGTRPPGVIPGAPRVSFVYINEQVPGVDVTRRTVRADYGARNEYSVVLTSEPSGPVTITPTSDNPRVTITPASLTFQPAGWHTPQTFTVVPAPGSTGARATITHSVSGYGSVTTAPEVTVTVGFGFTSTTGTRNGESPGQQVTPLPGSRSRLSGRRSRLPGSRSRLSGSRSRLPGSRSRLSGRRSRLPGSRSRLSGRRSRLPGSRSRPPDSRSRLPGSRSRPPDSEPRRLAVVEAEACQTLLRISTHRRPRPRPRPSQT